MVLNYNDNVKVYSLPADKMGAHGKIYWYAKALDKTGMGKVRLNIEDAAKYFDVTTATIYRWIKRCYKDQFFRYYKFNRDGTATVVIRSYKALPALLNLKKLGQVVWCDRGVPSKTKAISQIGINYFALKFIGVILDWIDFIKPAIERHRLRFLDTFPG